MVQILNNAFPLLLCYLISYHFLIQIRYGFQCRCGACSLEGQELILDEAARTRVREIQGLLADSSTAQHQVALVPLPYLVSVCLPETIASIGFVDCCEFSVYVFKVKM